MFSRFGGKSKAKVEEKKFIPPPKLNENDPQREDEKECLAFLEAKLGDRLNTCSKMTVLRFCRGFLHLENPQEAALDMITKYLDWRIEKKVDEIVAANSADMPGRTLFKKAWPHGVHGQGRQGNPVYIERLGKTDPAALFKEWTLDEMLAFHIKAMEELCQLKDRLAVARNKNVYKHVVVLDLDGLGWAHCTPKLTGPLQMYMATDQNFYPESLYCMIILNGGWTLNKLWGWVTPYLDPLTASRIHICETTEKLNEYVSVENIPRFLGGKCACEGGRCLEVPFKAGGDAPSLDCSPIPAASPQDEKQAEDVAVTETQSEVEKEPQPETETEQAQKPVSTGEI